MRIRALQHVSIRSRDLDRARDFYERLLGLPTVPRPELGFPGAWYGIGTSQLHLIAHEKLMDGIDPTDPHFALEVESLEAVRRELEARGVPFLDFGGSQLWVRDPDTLVREINRFACSLPTDSHVIEVPPTPVDHAIDAAFRSLRRLLRRHPAQQPL